VNYCTTINYWFKPW